MQDLGISALQICFSILRVGLKQLQGNLPTCMPSSVTVVLKIRIFLLGELLSREK